MRALKSSGATLVQSLQTSIVWVFFFLSCLVNFNAKELAKLQCLISDTEFFLPNFCLRIQRKLGFVYGYFIQNLHADHQPGTSCNLKWLMEFEICMLKGLSLAIEQEDTESELLQHFLVLSQEQRQKHAGKLMDETGSVETDIKEIVRRRCAIRPLSAEESSSSSAASSVPEMRLIRNIHQLESAYFAARVDAHLPEARYRLRPDRDLLRNRDNTISEIENSETWSSDDRVGEFFDGLCKYARYSKFETRGVLRTGELNSNSNVICSLGFDRDEEDYFATAGVSRKIKIFEFNSLFNESVDIHYPAVEMPNRSKLSGVCWNNYIRNYLASSDYDGIVKLWDVTTGQAISHFIEHEKRAWSVDFSEACPTKLASGSDDCSVKLWNINEACSSLPLIVSNTSAKASSSIPLAASSSECCSIFTILHR